MMPAARVQQVENLQDIPKLEWKNPKLSCHPCMFVTSEATTMQRWHEGRTEASTIQASGYLFVSKQPARLTVFAYKPGTPLFFGP